MSNKFTGWRPEKNSLTGQKLGRLTIYERVESPLASDTNLRAKWAVHYRCICDCGKEVIISRDSLTSKRTESCGCLRLDRLHATHTHYNDLYPVEYHAWKCMRQRCTNPKDKEYPRYGGRGISIDPAWDDFIVFYRELGPKLGKEFSLDRIDVEGDYCKDNCRWATATTQANNRRNNHRITYDNTTLTVTEWAREIGMKPEILFKRLERRKENETVDQIMKKARGE